MGSKIVLVGAGAAGKDHLRLRYQERGFKFGVSCTTRPMRSGEIEGVDYNFYTDDEFKSIVGAGAMLESQYFNNWTYGITKEAFEDCDIMIMNAEAVNLLPKEYRDRIFVIYVDIDKDIRLERLKSRKDLDNPERRIAEDDKQFRNFSNFDCRITNTNF
jgi:guanylate kinase